MTDEATVSDDGLVSMSLQELAAGVDAARARVGEEVWAREVLDDPFGGATVGEVLTRRALLAPLQLEMLERMHKRMLDTALDEDASAEIPPGVIPSSVEYRGQVEMLAEALGRVLIQDTGGEDGAPPDVVIGRTDSALRSMFGFIRGVLGWCPCSDCAPSGGPDGLVEELTEELEAVGLVVTEMPSAGNQGRGH